LHTHPSKLYRDKAADRYPPRPIESCQNGQAARLPSNFPSGIHPAFSGEMAYQGQTATAQPFCQLSDTADNGTAVREDIEDIEKELPDFLGNQIALFL